MFKNKQVIIGSLAIILAALLWSIDGIFIRPTFYMLPASLVVFWEHLLGFIVLSPFIVLNWRKIRGLSRKSWGAIIWVCVFGGMIGTIFITKAFFLAMAGTTSFATVIILQKLQPIFALLLARLVLREKLSKYFYLWAVVAIVAGYFLAFGGTGLSLREIDWMHSAALFAVIASFAFGSSTVFGKRIANHLNFRAVTALRFGITSVLVLALILITGDFFKVNLISTTHWWLLGLIVLTSGAGAMFIYYFGLRKVSASTTTILELFWPFSAIVLDYLFHGNTLNSIQTIAFIILLITFFRVSALGKPKILFIAKVIRGRGKGRILGYPTANLDRTELDMPHGIYVVDILVQGEKYRGLMHFGFIEVFKGPVSLEVLIKDFSDDIYGKEVKVKVVKKIREVKKFKDSEQLKEAIKRDLEVL